MRSRQVKLLLLPLSFVVLATFAVAQSPINVDVIGIKPGMPANNALQALKADNPRLKLTSSTYKVEGFASPLIPLVDSSDMAPTENAGVVQPSERVQLLLTTAPSPEVVWGVYRYYKFATSKQPSMQATIDALRNKYGPESVPAGPPKAVQDMMWVYDLQGKPLGPAAARLNAACRSTLYLYNSDTANMTLNVDLHGLRNWPADCASVIIVYAAVQGMQVSSNTFAASAMEVHMFDGGRYRKAMDATQAVIQNAVKARQNGAADDVNNHPTPKL